MAKITSEIRASQWSVKAEELIKNSTLAELKDFILKNGEVEEDPDEEGRIHDGKENLWGKTYMITAEGFHHDEFFITYEGRIFFLISLNHQVEIIDEERNDTMTIEAKRLQMEERLANLQDWLDSALDDDSVSDAEYEAVQKEERELKEELHTFEMDILEGKYDDQGTVQEEEPKTYAVYEGHMDALKKKITTIQNKCRKYGCDFSFKEVGEEFREVPTGESDPFTGKPIKVKCKFILVQAEGTAVINDWEFIASVEHTDAGNIFNKAMTDVEIPVRYRTAPCTCEHCNTNRIRKDTFIIRNTKTGEFKQVGKSCLMDFTHGMSASCATWFASLKNVFEEAEERPVSSWNWYQKFYDTKEVLQFTAETIRHFGFRKSCNSGDSTRDIMTRFFDLTHGNTKYWEKSFIEETKDLMKQVGFNPDSQEAVKMTEDALDWLEGQEASNDYLHNLKTVCSLPEVNSGKFGLLVSLFPSFNKDLELQDRLRREAEAGKNSNHVGQVGDRITVDVESVKCITSWESCYDGYSTTTTYIWKITGKDGNIFTWKTSKCMNEEVPPKTIKGTVKEHKIFRDVKQTELTRCKIN